MVNILAKWPLFYREMMQQSCSINLSGKEGKGMALDEFVESRIVGPSTIFQGQQ